MPLAFVLAVAWLAPAASAQNLILNDLYSQVKTVVYEIPQQTGHAEAVSSVEWVRDHFYRGAEIVDATSMDDTALRQKIKGTFVLYTLLSEKSRLLPLTAKPLPLRLENGTLRWGAVAAPVDGLRVIFVGKNPYAEGYAVVYAAGSNALLARANEPNHGSCSFHIFQGAGPGQLLAEGFYDGNFVQRSDRLSVDGATSDAREFFSILEKNRPHLYAKVTAQQYRLMKERTLRELTEKADASGSIRVEDLAYSLYYAAAFLKDAHTSVHWQPVLTPANTLRKRFPPFWIESENGRFFVTSARDQSLPGAELLAISGAPMQDFLKPALERISAETATYRAASLVANQLFWYCFADLFHDNAYRVKVRDANGAIEERTVETVGFAEFRYLAPHWNRHEGTFVEFLDDGRTARLVCTSLIYTGDRDKTNQVFDGIFDQIRQHKSTDIILDIRGNGGGDSRMGDYILRFLRAGQSDPPSQFFQGKSYLLVDHYVFSSAVILADEFRDFKVGTIVGYETGGVPTHFGYPRNFSLPNSGIGFGVSRTWFKAPKPRPGDDVHGVLPDVPVSRDVLAPYRGEADPVLAFTLAYIRAARASPARAGVGGPN